MYRKFSGIANAKEQNGGTRLKIQRGDFKGCTINYYSFG